MKYKGNHFLFNLRYLSRFFNFAQDFIPFFGCFGSLKLYITHYRKMIRRVVTTLAFILLDLIILDADLRRDKYIINPALCWSYEISATKIGVETPLRRSLTHGA